MDRNTPLTAQQVDLKYRPVTLNAWIWLVNQGIHIGRRKKLKIVIAEAARLGRQLKLEEVENLPVIQEAIKKETKKVPQYTVDDLRKAREELDLLNERDANDTSGNINKYCSRIKSAQDRVNYIERDLKLRGIIEMSEVEKLDHDLDQLYPYAKNHTVVTHAGKKYEIKYFPRRMSRSRKTVMEWAHQWVPIEKTSAST